MNKILEIINEEISAISKDKDKEVFNYRYLTNKKWNELAKLAQKFQKINFDFENDDTTGQKKVFYIKKDLRKNQPVKYSIAAELFEAGGDWEYPVLYFRLQINSDYGIIKSDEWMKTHEPEYIWDLPATKKMELYKCYCIIPPVEAGNKLIKVDKKSGDYEWMAYQADGMTKEEEKLARITDADKKNCWKWLSELLSKVVDERHEMLDK
jgi:hypothetical protein